MPESLHSLEIKVTPQDLYNKLAELCIGLLRLNGVCEIEAIDIIKANQLFEMISALATNLEYIDPSLEKLLERILPILQNKFEWLQAIIVLGSGSNGGLTIRKTLNRINSPNSKTDFDYGVIYDPTKIPTDLNSQMFALQVELDSLFKSHSQYFGFCATYYGCTSLNPKFFHTPHLPSVTPQKIIRKYPYLYFRPSYPKSISAQNRHLVPSFISEYDIGQLLFTEKPHIRGFSWKEKYFTNNEFSLQPSLRDELRTIQTLAPAFLSQVYFENLAQALSEIKSQEPKPGIIPLLRKLL